MNEKMNLDIQDINNMSGLPFYIFNNEDLKSKRVFSHIFPDLFKNDNAYIEYKWLKVYPSFIIDILSECKIQIQWVKARQDIPQGIDSCINNVRLKILDGSKRETKSGFAFMYGRWVSDKVPLLCVPIKYRKKEKQRQEKWFMLKNIWEMKRSDGRMERCSWGGNYGVLMEQREKDVYRLYFSCGDVDHPNITFQDLVIDVAIEGEYTN